MTFRELVWDDQLKSENHNMELLGDIVIILASQVGVENVLTTNPYFVLDVSCLSSISLSMAGCFLPRGMDFLCQDVVQGLRAPSYPCAAYFLITRCSTMRSASDERGAFPP